MSLKSPGLLTPSLYFSLSRKSKKTPEIQAGGMRFEPGTSCLLLFQETHFAIVLNFNFWWWLAARPPPRRHHHRLCCTCSRPHSSLSRGLTPSPHARPPSSASPQPPPRACAQSSHHATSISPQKKFVGSLALSRSHGGPGVSGGGLI